MDPSSGGLDRREFLYIGLVGGLGLTLPNFLRLRALQSPLLDDGPGQAVANAAARAAVEPKAKAVIHIFLPGGIAQQESFDPKPYAPIEYRGPFGSVDTKITGVRFSQHFKRTAKIADRLLVVRTMSHGEAAHERGTHNMFTGYRPSPAIQYPSFGSIVSHELGSRNDLPPYVCVPSLPSNFAGTGYLGSAFGAFSLGADPSNREFKVRDLSLPGGIDEARFTQRREMRAAVDAHFSALEKSDALDGMDSFYSRAYAMISSDKARAAFSLKDEPEKLRAEYGLNNAGQRMLLSRRLVEAGVRVVSLSYGGSDHRDNIKRAM